MTTPDSHKRVTNLQKAMFYKYPLVMPVSWTIIPLCKLAEQRKQDFYPGLFLAITRRNLKDQPSWMRSHARQEIVRAFSYNEKHGVFKHLFTATSRGRKRKLYKLTPKGEIILKNFPAHLQHFILAAQEDLA